MAKYDEFTSPKNPGRPVRVESAKRDGSGKNIENNYAKQTGYYAELGVGQADNLTPYGDNSGILSNSKFTFQTSGGDKDVGSVAELRALYGRSMKWNQLSKNSSNQTVTANGITVTYQKDGPTTVSGEKTASASVFYTNKTGVFLKRYHKVALRVYVQGTLAGNNLDIKVHYGLGVNIPVGTYTEPTLFEAIGEYNRSEQTSQLMSNPAVGTVFTNFVISNFQVFDLTEIFGEGNEPTTVKEFNKIFPKPYYEYNEGEIIHSKSNAYKIVGYNAFDISNPTSFIRVVPEETYTVENTNGGSLKIYDANETLIDTVSLASDYEIVELPVNAYYVKLIDYTSTSCLHLTWDESKIGFEEYYDKTYPLPNIELRGIGNVRDELRPDGTLIRRIGVISDASQLNWNIHSSNGKYFFYVSGTSSLNIKQSNDTKLLCTKYPYSTLANSTGTIENKVIGINNWGVYTFIVRDDNITTLEAFKTAMSGIYLYYELATPVIETIPQFISYTDIDDFGTQEFTSELPLQLPQENEIFYVADYKAFMDSLGGREDIGYDAGEIVSHTELQAALASFLSSIPGYDATKNQVLKNVEGTFTWVDDE